jgi:hypothetical protein
MDPCELTVIVLTIGNRLYGCEVFVPRSIVELTTEIFPVVVVLGLTVKDSEIGIPLLRVEGRVSDTVDFSGVPDCIEYEILPDVILI